MDHDRRNEQIAPSNVAGELIDKHLQVTAGNLENIPASTPQEQDDIIHDTPSSPKPIRRSTTLSEHKERSIDKDRDARNAKAESKYLTKCDRLEQTAQGSNISEKLRKEKQDRLDEGYQKKLAKNDKRYHRKLEKAEQMEKVKNKQDESSPSSQSSTHASHALAAPTKESKENRVKSFFNSIPSPSGDSSYSTRHTSAFNPAVGGAALPMMDVAGFGGGVGTSGCDGGGAAVGVAGGCNSEGACRAGASGS